MKKSTWTAERKPTLEQTEQLETGILHCDMDRVKEVLSQIKQTTDSKIDYLGYFQDAELVFGKCVIRGNGQRLQLVVEAGQLLFILTVGRQFVSFEAMSRVNGRNRQLRAKAIAVGMEEVSVTVSRRDEDGEYKETFSGRMQWANPILEGEEGFVDFYSNGSEYVAWFAIA